MAPWAASIVLLPGSSSLVRCADIPAAAPGNACRRQPMLGRVLSPLLGSDPWQKMVRVSL
jgi:hypothetical protein